MTITPARDALYDALITGTQHAQIREHLVDAALEEDRATHAAGLGSTAEDEAALASLRGMATTAHGVAGSSPFAMSAVTISGSVRTPMSTTSVVPERARAA